MPVTDRTTGGPGAAAPVPVLRRPEQLRVQRPQFRPRIRAEPVRQESSYVLVGGQGLRRAARVAQGAQAQRLEGFVQGVGVAQGGQLGQGLFGVAEGEGGGVAGAQGVEAPGLLTGRLGGAVGEVGEGGAVPEREGVVEGDGGLGGVAVGQRARALADEPLEPVQVDVVGQGGEAVSAVRRDDLGRPERPPQPADERLQRASGVGGRPCLPHLVDQHARRHGPAAPQREHSQKGTQTRPAERNGAAVGAYCLGGAEDAIAHGPIVSGRFGEGHGVEVGGGSEGSGPVRPAGGAHSTRPRTPGGGPEGQALRDTP